MCEQSERYRSDSDDIETIVSASWRFDRGVTIRTCARARIRQQRLGQKGGGGIIGEANYLGSKSLNRESEGFMVEGRGRPEESADIDGEAIESRRFREMKI